MAGYEMTPEGLRPMGESQPAPKVIAGGALINSIRAGVKADGEAQQSLPHPQMQPQPKATKPNKPEPMAGLGPRGVIKAAKARINELKRELRRHEKLKAELAELERLVEAAKTPPAPVRALRARDSA